MPKIQEHSHTQIISFSLTKISYKSQWLASLLQNAQIFIFNCRSIREEPFKQSIGATGISIFISPSILIIFTYAIYLQNKHNTLYYYIMQQTSKETSFIDHSLNQDSHNFTIKKTRPSLRNSMDASVDFPKISKSMPQNRMQQEAFDDAPLKTFPIFNSDYKYFTPCFILGSEKLKVFNWTQFYYEQHLKKVNDMSSEKQQLFLPKPSQRHIHCSLCRTRYQDYLQHISSQSHKARQGTGKFTKKIQFLVKLMDKSEKKRVRLAKKAEKQCIMKEKKIKKQLKERAKPKRQNKIQLANSSTEANSLSIQI